MQLTSNLFDDQGTIPVAYTCKGQNISPSLHIEGTPPGTQSLALVMHDPDAPNGDFTHWVIWNIPTTTTDITEGTTPDGSIQGTNGFGTVGYGGPCPPSGTHRYMFELYALDTLLELPAGSDRVTIKSKLGGHLLAQTLLTGLFSAS